MHRIEHGAVLGQQLSDLSALAEAGVEDTEDEQDARLVLKFQASTRLENGPFTKLGFTPLGEGGGWNYYVLSTVESRELLATVLGEYEHLSDDIAKNIQWDHPATWLHFLDDIDGIEVYGPEDRADPSLSDLTFTPATAVDCLLWPSRNAAVAADRVAVITELVSRHTADNPSIRIAASDPRPDRTLLRVVVDEALLGELLSQAEVERVRRPLHAPISHATLSQVSMPPDTPDPAQTPIGVVDGVVNAVNPLLGPYVLNAQGFPDGHVFAGADTHGTSVAGAAVWGDLDPLVLQGALGTPHPILSARVLDLAVGGGTQVAGPMTHLTVEEAIRWLAAQGVRIVNLSINYPIPADTALRDELTVTIDTLARKLNLVIVISAGNRLDPGIRHWLHDYPTYLADPDARIASPGDAALAVTVGAHTRRDVPAAPNGLSKVAIAQAQQPSPFTRSGPARGIGKAGMLKPEFSHHGGNWAWDDQFQRPDRQDPGTGVLVAIPPSGSRIVGVTSGTSYSAPAVAHEIARIAERYPEASANLLRALTALSARPLSSPGTGITSTHVGGYGQPDADRVLESGPHRVFLVTEETITANTVVVHRLPIPAEYADGARSRSFRVALAFDPPVRRGRREYIAGTMQVELVRGLNSQQLAQIYQKQPSAAAAEKDPSVIRHRLPGPELRPRLLPGATEVASNTLIRREFLGGTWDPEHEDYFLVVTHTQSAWTQAQRREYPTQTYALAVEIAEEGESDLDLYALIRARLRGRLRVR